MINKDKIFNKGDIVYFSKFAGNGFGIITGEISDVVH